MRLTLLAFLLAFAGYAHAQVSANIGANPDELRALAKRTLVVELPEVNSKVIEQFKDDGKDNLIGYYEGGLSNYRAEVEQAIRKYWTYNKDIEFKTTSEIIQLFKDKDPRYVALLKVVLTPEGAYGYTSGVGVPVMVYTATDGASKVDKRGQLQLTKWDFQIYLATRFLGEMYSDATWKFSMIQGQQFLAWNTAPGRTRSESFIKYMKDQSEKNCGKLAGKQVLMEKNALSDKWTAAQAVDYYGRNLQLVDFSVVESDYLNGDAENAIMVSVPVGTGISFDQVLARIVVDPSTDQILGCIPASDQRGITKTEMSILKKCK